jgi:hypothetical protein
MVVSPPALERPVYLHVRFGNLIDVDLAAEVGSLSDLEDDHYVDLVLEPG